VITPEAKCVSSKASFFERSIRILRLASKPGWKEYRAAFQISILGLSIVGSIGFVIQLLATVLTAGAVG
jgi:protein translocase SEC61 complex gamma subunit